MKKIILMFAMIAFAVFTVKGDEQSEAVLKKVADTFQEYGNYEVKFTVYAKGMGTMKGNYFVSGSKYYIKIQKQEHFSDGVNRYEIYNSDREIIIDEADIASRNILNNPTRAFEFLPDEFNSEWLGRKQIDNVMCSVIRLTPCNTNYGDGIVTLYVGEQSGMPVVVEYDYLGEEISVTIDKITPLETVDQSMFVFDPSKYGNYEVIDFR